MNSGYRGIRGSSTEAPTPAPNVVLLSVVPTMAVEPRRTDPRRMSGLPAELLAGVDIALDEQRDSALTGGSLVGTFTRLTISNSGATVLRQIAIRWPKIAKNWQR